MIRHIWSLSEAGDDNLGLACTNDGLLLGRTPLIERRDRHFIIREQSEIEHLLGRAYRTDVAVARLMPGLATVASALNANDQCLARIAAVHLRIPDLPDREARDDMEAADILIKFAREEGGSSNWNPALHPRTGIPPNPGWFAPAGEADGDESSRVRTAQSDNPAIQTDTPPNLNGDWVRLPPSRYPGEYIDELHDFLEWLANAKPEEEGTIRAEINRYYFAVGDIQGGQILHSAFSNILDAPDDKGWRQAVLNDIASFARVDPAEMGQLQFGGVGAILALPGAAIRAIVPEISVEAGVTAPGAVAGEVATGAAVASRSQAWQLGWAARGRYFEEQLGRTLHPNFPIIDRFVDGVATSIKSIDLNAPVYQNAARLAYRLNKYVEDVAQFDGVQWGGDEVKGSQIMRRAVSVAVPKGSISADKREVIEAIQMRAKMTNMHAPVDVYITEY